VDNSESLLLPAALRDRTSFVLIKLAALARQGCAEQLAAVGLSQHQHAILCCLDEFGQASQKGIGTRLGIDGGDIVAFVDGLQRAGLITRERDERDRRRQILGITATGRRLLRRVEKLMDAAEPGPLAALTPEQRALLHACATEVLAADAPRSWVPGERLAGAARAADGERVAEVTT
jgi:MarR family transcriptional regulator, lower aerobic nicotinate degradation pathway regulator